MRISSQKRCGRQRKPYGISIIPVQNPISILLAGQHILIDIRPYELSGAKPCVLYSILAARRSGVSLGAPSAMNLNAINVVGFTIMAGHVEGICIRLIRVKSGATRTISGYSYYNKSSVLKRKLYQRDLEHNHCCCND